MRTIQRSVPTETKEGDTRIKVTTNNNGVVVYYSQVYSMSPRYPVYFPMEWGNLPGSGGFSTLEGAKTFICKYLEQETLRKKRVHDNAVALVELIQYP